MDKEKLQEFIQTHLTGQQRQAAEQFALFLQEKKLDFTRDRGYWRDKIYYIVEYRGEGVCYIAICDPDEPEHSWTVWSDDMECDGEAEPELARSAWDYVDHCGGCGSCGGGRRKLIFGRDFTDVCGCTFRIDNPTLGELPFMQKMVELRMRQIEEKGYGE